MWAENVVRDAMLAMLVIGVLVGGCGALVATKCDSPIRVEWNDAR